MLASQILVKLFYNFYLHVQRENQYSAYLLIFILYIADAKSVANLLMVQPLPRASNTMLDANIGRIILLVSHSLKCKSAAGGDCGSTSSISK